ncbi:interferon-induced protein with tetratricopeptide repeats 1-like [Suricata suricatta]|uniref:interferon-induced protein with tetratricopeptide repeats 1-like n=1 Tax=Suricata suricatta TaxID=37032 RepID=UPI001155FE73|nr:interferon-induced protein with tetratricopeptide repeats 1-like [Suricata suricatta]
MSKDADEVRDKLGQLRCHFTWELLFEDSEMPDLENRILDEIEFLDTKYNVGIYNLLAYIKHLKGQNQEALGSLKELDKALQLLQKALQATPSSAFLHHQIGLCYRAQMIQIKRAAKWQPRGQDRENIDKMVKLAISHFQFALEQKPTFGIAYIHLASMYIEAGNYRKAEDVYQKLFCLKSLDEETLQQAHFYYGQFQEFQKKSEVNAVIHYLKVLKIEKVSLTRNKCINSLEKLTLRKLSRNASDIESLSILGFIYKVQGEMHKALEHYEQALQLAADSGNSGM